MASQADAGSAPDSVAGNLASVRARIARAAADCGREPSDVRLILATKTVAPQRIREAVHAGETHLAENRVQEGRTKAVALADLPIRWSMIGHLQTNKARDALRFADEVQSLDRLTLAETLDRALQRLGRPLDALVQVNTSGEATKYGLLPEDVPLFLRELRAFAALRIRGFMTLASFTDDMDEVRRCFRVLRAVRDEARQTAPQGAALRELSMGMSGDFEAAVAEGATMVRVGQAVFGQRPLPDSYYWPAAPLAPR